MFSLLLTLVALHVAVVYFSVIAVLLLLFLLSDVRVYE